MTLRIFAEIAVQIQRYLRLQVATSALLGVVVGIAFAALGLDNALFWACCGALLHMIPYVGPAVFLVIVSMVAYVQFPTWVPVAAVILSILLSTGIIGMLLVPWMTQRGEPAQCRHGVHLAAVLELAMGYLGSAPGASDHDRPERSL